jgi:response regulator RpfG family c-di-GMP phosphodiesterase/DNA-binding CsgD family transcriptional regulator
MHRFNLTKQELSVLSYLNEGLTVKALARNLDISIHTVNGHMKSIYFKMNVKSRGEAQHKFNAYKAVIANEELSFQNKEKAKRADELIIANSEKADRAAELVIANEELSFQNKEKAKRAQELVIANSEKANRAAELVIANEELSFQNKEKAKRAEELVNANVAKTYRAAELVIANDEKTYRAAELVIANEELSFQNKEKAKRAQELVIANSEKADRAAELVIANSEKADRAAELEAMLLGKNSTNKKVYQTESQFLSCLNALAMARDNETENHILRTQHYVKTIALRLKEMGNYKIELSAEMIKLLFKAAPLHDIGKIGIPDSILHKLGRLNDVEWQVMKTHASIGQAILASTELKIKGGSGVITVAIKIAAEHHEKWDGSGYPSGLKGEEISLPARIMALADFYDALMSRPIYKSGLSHEDAESQIVSQRGAHFDPLVVDAFMLEKAGFLAIHSKYKDDQLL